MASVTCLQAANIGIVNALCSALLNAFAKGVGVQAPLHVVSVASLCLSRWCDGH